MDHRKIFLRTIKKYAAIIRQDEADGFSPSDCIDGILDKAPEGSEHARWIADNRRECEQAIAGIMGLT